MSRTTERTSTRAERLLRRVALLMAIGLVGLLAGVIAQPALRSAYYVGRLRSPNAAERIHAMNVVASLCPRDAGCADAFVDAVLREPAVGTPQTRALAEQIAGWTLERSPSVRAVLAKRLRDADDDTFLVAAALFRRAGLWRLGHRTPSELARREVLRMGSPDATTRVAALEALADLGPVVADSVAGHLDAWREDASDAVRRAVVSTTSICLQEDKVHDALVPFLGDEAPTVRCEAVIRMALHEIEMPGRLLRDEEPSVREATAWAMGHRTKPGNVSQLLAVLADDPVDDVKAMAVWAIGRQSSRSVRLPPAAFQRLDASDPVLTARILIALGRLGQGEDAYDAVSSLAGSASIDVALAAVFAMGRLPGDSAHWDGAIARLRSVVEESLRQGHGVVTAAACEALAELGDRPFAPVMRDIAAELDEQPMVQFAAAISALRLDRSFGTAALLGLLDCEADAVCDLAAIRLGQLPSPPVHRLVELLIAGNERARASAALSLGFSALSDTTVGDERFDAFLRRRTDPISGVYEKAWKPHGYFLCARLLLGDDVRDALDPFLRNENFCRVGLYVALLRTGDTLPLDLLLTRESPFDVESFLRDARFIDVIRAHDPDAPVFLWLEDERLRRWQVERLRDWWAVRRRREEAKDV